MKARLISETFIGLGCTFQFTKKNKKNEKQKKGEKNMKTETLITSLLVAAVAVLIAYFVFVAIQNFNLDLFIKSLMY